MMHLPQTSLLLFLLIPSAAFSLPSDRDKPINIEADHAQMDDASGVAQYKGDAVLTQGTLQIEGDVITFYYDENKELLKIVSEGELATYEQVHDQGKEPVKARALMMEYLAGAQKIYLMGQGYIWQSGDEFKGNQIEYDIAKNLVLANSRPVEIAGQQQTSGRVHVTIQPPGQKNNAASSSAPTPQAPLTPAPEQTSEQQYPNGMIDARLNVRTGPGVQYDRLNTFNPNTQVLILTRQNDWVQVKGLVENKAIIGWVNQRYVRTE